MNRTLPACVLSAATLARADAQPVKKAEYRVPDTLFSACGYYDVRPRDGTWKMRKADFEGKYADLRNISYKNCANLISKIAFII